MAAYVAEGSRSSKVCVPGSFYQLGVSSEISHGAVKVGKFV